MSSSNTRIAPAILPTVNGESWPALVGLKRKQSGGRTIALPVRGTIWATAGMCGAGKDDDSYPRSILSILRKLERMDQEGLLPLLSRNLVINMCDEEEKVFCAGAKTEADVAKAKQTLTEGLWLGGMEYRLVKVEGESAIEVAVYAWLTDPANYAIQNETQGQADYGAVFRCTFERAQEEGKGKKRNAGKKRIPKWELIDERLRRRNFKPGHVSAGFLATEDTATPVLLVATGSLSFKYVPIIDALIQPYRAAWTKEFEALSEEKRGDTTLRQYLCTALFSRWKKNASQAITFAKKRFTVKLLTDEGQHSDTRFIMRIRCEDPMSFELEDTGREGSRREVSFVGTQPWCFCDTRWKKTENVGTQAEQVKADVKPVEETIKPPTAQPADANESKSETDPKSPTEGTPDDSSKAQIVSQ